MLQQTRVTAVEPYFRKFLALFPDVEALARARPQSVLRAWAGLGYYSRVRMLHQAARQIRAAGFPSSYEGWLELPGVGPYTAAAVSSIAFGEPRAVVDGNVRRVLSRVFAITENFEEAAANLLDRRRPGDFNQALMELGATVCLPRAPRCPECPLAAECRARRAGAVPLFPPRPPRRRPQRIVLRLALVERDGAVLLARPGAAKLWPRFWSLPELPHTAARRLGSGPRIERGSLKASFRHTVTFRDLHVRVYSARLLGAAGDHLRFVKRSSLSRLPLATPAKKAIALRVATRLKVLTS